MRKDQRGFAHPKRQRREGGFTLVEVVIALLGVVVALLVAAWLLAPVAARFQSTRQAPPSTAAQPAPYGTAPVAWPNGTVFVPCRDRACGPALDAFAAAYRHCEVLRIGPLTVNGQTEGYYFFVRTPAP